MNINCRKVLDCGLSRDGLLPKKEVLILCDIRMHCEVRELRLNHMKERKEKKIRKERGAEECCGGCPVQLHIKLNLCSWVWGAKQKE